MARQIGEIKITGTIDGICFYKMRDKYYVRMKSSLTGKRFGKDKAFEGSRRSCERLAIGSRIASVVYQEIAKGKKNYALYCRLKREAIRLLKEGVEGKNVLQQLQDRFRSKKNKCRKKAEKISFNTGKLKPVDWDHNLISSLFEIPLMGEEAILVLEDFNQLAILCGNCRDH